ncbi:hypothetical protein CONCODRAFT_9188 [Conidiobolus coronatus NRRL 28638]|uniref:Glutaminyl-tRNA synthetase class Ib non-specific RNA-binding domain-containing protein n=1 Tax=Conidiobolus coronatus (strain ATCC 28846 / CBS 209.66 / NRRL 28638) TaxID=796925 RepID=A0A137P143_CONC2|nr:hypothetical protein CONCODRAFT_9188 [Conidiobolus coronatus NRRL 28638]|eukprot:KXN68589.1 hypothetical protein CONCODRAFT_9188 [Conidiobolus coronatus NRRL 28638]
MEDLILKFQTIGLSEAKAKDTTKNKKLCPILENLVDSEPLKQLSLEEKLEFGPLFYLLICIISAAIQYFNVNSTEDRDGNIVPWNPPGHRWVDGSVETDLPMQKLSELFNINHFIVAQVNPHVVPFLSNQPITKSSPKLFKDFSYLVKEELSHRIYQMIESGIFRSALFRLISIISSYLLLVNATPATLQLYLRLDL